MNCSVCNFNAHWCSVAVSTDSDTWRWPYRAETCYVKWKWKEKIICYITDGLDIHRLFKHSVSGSVLYCRWLILIRLTLILLSLSILTENLTFKGLLPALNANLKLKYTYTFQNSSRRRSLLYFQAALHLVLPPTYMHDSTQNKSRFLKKKPVCAVCLRLW
jgi:hypothetical protein